MSSESFELPALSARQVGGRQVVKMLSDLYDVETHTINYPLKKIFTDSELEEAAVIRKFRITAQDVKSYNPPHYKGDKA